MNKIILTNFAVLALAFSLFATEPESGCDAFSLRYVDVKDTFKRMKEHHPDLSGAVKGFHPERNIIILDSGSPSLYEARKFLTELDQRPKQVVYTATISEMTPGNPKSERVIVRPTVTALEARAAVFNYRLENGKELRISVLASAPAEIKEK